MGESLKIILPVFAGLLVAVVVIRFVIAWLRRRFGTPASGWRTSSAIEHTSVNRMEPDLWAIEGNARR